MGCQAYKCFPLLGKLLIDWELIEAPVLEVKRKVKLSQAEKDLAAKYQKRYIEKGRKAPIEPNPDDFDSVDDDDYLDALEKFEDYEDMKRCYESLDSFTSEESNELTHRALIIAIAKYIADNSQLTDAQMLVLGKIIAANTDNDDSTLITDKLITPKAAPKPKVEAPATTPAPPAPKAE